MLAVRRSRGVCLRLCVQKYSRLLPGLIPSISLLSAFAFVDEQLSETCSLPRRETLA